jgi:hypothetical protein
LPGISLIHVIRLETIEKAEEGFGNEIERDSDQED